MKAKRKSSEPVNLEDKTTLGFKDLISSWQSLSSLSPVSVWCMRLTVPVLALNWTDSPTHFVIGLDVAGL